MTPRFGRMFWVTCLVTLVDTAVGLAASAGILTAEVAGWIIAGVTSIGSTHNLGRAFEDGMTKRRPNGVPTVQAQPHGAAAWERNGAP